MLQVSNMRYIINEGKSCQAGSRKHHMLTFTSEKPFQCGICSKGVFTGWCCEVTHVNMT